MNIKILIISIVLLFSLQGVPAQTASTKLNANIVDLSEGKYSNTSLDDILKSYEGKVLYLDFWASWCGPCKREMPYSQSMKKEFAGKDVAFVYISTDNNPDKWKSMINQLEISGDHYRASPRVRDQIVKKFNLQYIPRYVLIDKSGKIVSDNAKRPSNPAAANDIKDLLM